MKKGMLYAFLLSFSLFVTGCAVSDAGTDQTVVSGEKVTLDGSGSSSTTGKELSFRWRQLSGPKVTLENENEAQANFIAPEVTSKTALRFALIVREQGTYSVSMDTVLITVNPRPATTGVMISGVVTDVNHTPISGAIVQVGEKKVVTDDKGMYKIPGVNKSQRVIINVSHADYLKNSRIVDVSDKNVTQDVVLDTPKATLTFMSDEGGVVSEDDGAKVELPAGGYTDKNGRPYDGEVTVKMSYHPITTRSGRATFPGTFEGVENNGTTFPIQSYGFMNVELTDSQGNPLNLDGNATATLTFPVDRNLHEAPVIPLWYYDEQSGYWVQEGEAVLQNSQTYIATVTHFTSWNLDAKGPVARYTGCVEDENGTKIPNVTVLFRALNWDSRTVYTDENGTISVYNVLANKPLTFSAYGKIGAKEYVGSKPIYLNEGDNVVDTECVVIKPIKIADGNYTVEGTVYTQYNNTPLPNAQVSLFDGDNILIGSATTDSQGKYRITFVPKDTLRYHINVDGGIRGGFGFRDFILQENVKSYQVDIPLYELQ